MGSKQQIKRLINGMLCRLGFHVRPFEIICYPEGLEVGRCNKCRRVVFLNASLFWLDGDMSFHERNKK